MDSLESVIDHAATFEVAFRLIKQSGVKIIVQKTNKVAYNIIDSREDFAILECEGKQYMHKYGTDVLYFPSIF